MLSRENCMQEDNLRANFIHLDGKTFGRIFECVVSRLDNYSKAENNSHDRFCKSSSKRIEVKSTRVFSSYEKINENNMVELLLNNKTSKTLLHDYQKESSEWNCGICQVKTDCFDFLYYCAVFHDKIYIFKITPEQILADKKLAYSKKQHRNGNMGQFHLSEATIRHHLDTYLHRTLNYKQLIAVLKYNPN